MDDLVQAIEEHERDETLPPIIGQITYDFKSLGKQKIPVEVRGYDEGTSSFIVVNEKRKIQTQRPRIYIELEGDHNSELRDVLATT